ncbi:MAG: hypothetical protein A7315_02125 [Candidatus Altiarchaeales archaeon WOR_SM1_79]|nr:MAG: hypothetical protein A7315_02125 [Candidatus Altiarchaeales archaeon WOR_SM1_79]
MSNSRETVTEPEEGIPIRTALMLGLFALIVVALYPLLYPFISYITSIFGLITSASLSSAIELYLKISGNDPFSGEHPLLASLPYWSKVELFYIANIQICIVFLVLTIVVLILVVISRIVPGGLLRSIIQVSSIILAMIPFTVVTLFALSMFFYSYYLAWGQWSGSLVGYIDFAILVILCPVVAIHVATAIFAIWFFSGFFVPSALAFAGHNSLAARFLTGFWSILEEFIDIS